MGFARRGEKASLVIALVFCGTVALELTDIAGSIKTSRYQIIKRQIALRQGKGHTEWWRILKWASAEYRDEFYRKLPRYWFRLISWSLLALAGIVLVSILGSCGADAKDTDQETASAAATPAPTAALLLATAIPTPTHTRPPTATRFPTSTAAPTSAGGGEFAAQRTRAAPTLAAVAILAPRLVNKTGNHHQWTLATNAASDQQRARYGLAGFRSITDRKGQPYTCAIYKDGNQVPRVNLTFSRDLTYTVVTNQFGERQGASLRRNSRAERWPRRTAAGCPGHRSLCADGPPLGTAPDGPSVPSRGAPRWLSLSARPHPSLSQKPAGHRRP